MNGEHPLPSTRERDIFLRALDQLSPQDCAAYLERACGDDQALRASVEALLKNYKDDDFLEMIALAARPSDLTAEKLGETIGPYKLLEQIGEGGCGVVYLAEQKIPIHRQVALKVIKLGMDTREVIARFEAERQVLAMMDHSNIAKVFDAGATKTGRPYFVMELVRGKKITDYCDGHKLPLLQRLDLFVKVCHAVQHAHQNNIIHRDIKPSNILVAEQDGTPMPKVIDFGIAKATTDQQLTDKTLFTVREQFIGTPAYMSPEQAESSGPEIDKRTDIYSLGVLLYELLVGCLPFALDEFQQNITDDILHAIRESEPPRPSIRLNNRGEKDLAKIAQYRQIEPPRLLQSLRGDLDCIVMKCLEKDRTRRYQTANDLAVEIQRYLKGEPITARPPSRFYRFQKMVQRNKLPFAAAAVAIALVLGIIGIWIASLLRSGIIPPVVGPPPITNAPRMISSSTSVENADMRSGLNRGLIAYYPLNGNANDESGNQRNGTIHGNLSFVPGISGQAAHFDGSTTYISVPDQPALRLQAPFSLSAWVKYEGTGRILHKQGYELTVDESGTGCVLGFNVWYRIRVMDVVHSPPLAKDAWHHVVVTHDGSRISLYINGVLMSQTPATGLVPQSTSDLNIGRNGYTGLDRFKGTIEEVRIYNRALSPNEIAQLDQPAHPSAK